MKKKPLIIIISVIASAAVLGAGAFIITRLLKTETPVEPETAVLNAFAETYAEIKTPELKLSRLFAELFNAPVKQDITLGFNKLAGSVIPLEPSMLSIAEVLTVKNATNRDPVNHRLLSVLSVQFAVTPLATVTLYGDNDILAVSAPQAFDYFITLDPRRVAAEWDGSLLGKYLFPIGGVILENEFYEYYNLILNAASNPQTVPAYIRHLSLLTGGAEYTSEGTERVYSDVMDKELDCDVYGVELTKQAVNAFLREINPANGLLDFFGGRYPGDLIGDYLRGLTDALTEAAVNGDVPVLVYIYDGKIRKLELNAGLDVMGETWNAGAEILLMGETANLNDVTIVLNLENAGSKYTLTVDSLRSDVGNPGMFISSAGVSLRDSLGETAFGCAWDIKWDKNLRTEDNFSLSLSARDGESDLFSLSADGSLYMDAADRHIEANIKKFNLNIPDGVLDVSLNFKYLLRHDGTEVTYDKSNAAPLTRINELDALSMYLRLLDDPQLSMILNQIN